MVSFDTWMAQVDAIFLNTLSMTAADFPDWAWRDAYECEMDPIDACRAYAEEYEYHAIDRAE